MRRWKLYAVAVLFVGVGIAGYCLHAARTITLPEEDWDIYEAVLRHQIFNSAAGGRGSATAYVEIQGGNPTGAFMARFQDYQPLVKPGWRFFRGSGVLYRMGAIRRTDADSAEVDGGYYEGSLSASSNTYYVVRKGGKWVVERDDMHWIS